MITVCHHSAHLVMPNGDPGDRFFYSTLTLMIDSYIHVVIERLDISEVDVVFTVQRRALCALIIACVLIRFIITYLGHYLS